MLEGFSLHATTHLHANDRQGQERLCRYGVRSALVLARLSRAEDGRIAHRITHREGVKELVQHLAPYEPSDTLSGTFSPSSRIAPEGLQNLG
ncbi:transposase [Archangium sp.]|uniref:transposase n=1 Tax=Archangium sp. TaxID=1872627 RepID=UPI002E360B57|nr:transposase [Archangium sp.]